MTTAFALYVDPNSNGQTAVRTNLRTMDWLVNGIKNDQQPKPGYVSLFNLLSTPDNQVVTDREINLSDITDKYVKQVDYIARRFRVYNTDFDTVKKGIHAGIDNLNNNQNHYLLVHENNTHRQGKTISTYLLLIPVDTPLNASDYKALTKSYIDNRVLKNLSFRIVADRANLFEAKFTQLPLELKDEYQIGNPDKTSDQYVNEKLLEAEKTTSKKKSSKKEIKTIQLNTERLKHAVSRFVANPETITMFNDPNRRFEFLKTLANETMSIKSSYPKHFDQDLLKKLVTGNINFETLQQEYQKAQEAVKNHFELDEKLPPLDSYIQISRSIQQDQDIDSMATMLQASVSSEIKELQDSNDVSLADAAELIAKIFKPYLLQTVGNTDRDKLVIFNPIKGFWTHDDDTFYSILTVVRPYSTMHDFETMMHTFAAKARNANRIIKPYNRSQHLLFLDGVLDVFNNEWHDLNSDYVRKLHMTERCQINIHFKNIYNVPIDQLPEPIMKGKLQAGGDWSPRNFIRAYGNNEPEKVQYFLFGLSLGLFAGHNFGAHFDIQGSSGWGKSTIADIFAGLFNNRVMMIPFQNLNGRFPFTSYPSNTSVIWIDECNIGTDPLNDEFGTPVYDALANSLARFQVKNDGDYILNDPPQVFVDGTQLLPSKEINTGPGRRTLVFELPAPSAEMSTAQIEQLHRQAFATSIQDLLQREDVLQYLVALMVYAYTHFLKFKGNERYQLKNLKIILANDNSFTRNLPKFALEWRKDMANAQNDLNEWFVDQMQPYFKTNEQAQYNTQNCTLMHDKLAYILYMDSYHDQHESDDPTNRFIISNDRFNREYSALLDTYGWQKVEAGGKDNRKQISTKNNLNFDWANYAKDNKMPNNITDDSKLPYPFRKKTRGWYYLVQRKDSNTN